MDREGDPDNDVRRRLREATSLSSNGLGRVETSGELVRLGGSDESIVRSIWQKQGTEVARSRGWKGRRSVEIADLAATMGN